MAMRAWAVIAIIILLYGCKHQPAHFSPDKTQRKFIGLQPLGNYDTSKLHFIRDELTHFYNTRVIILPSLSIPKSFLNKTKGERYSADSIILYLKSSLNDSISEVVGLTSKDIYTTMKDRDGHIQKPIQKYAVFGILGLGYLPGNTCVISDLRLKTRESLIFKHRLRTVVIHEIGHNLGLPHCPVKGCIMSDSNEKISTIDNSRNDYCEVCKLKLKQTQ